MEEPDDRMWWGSEFRTDVLRPVEANGLVRGVLADALALAERPMEPIFEVLGRP
jgi:hypothetical protein